MTEEPTKKRSTKKPGELRMPESEAEAIRKNHERLEAKRLLKKSRA